MLLPELNNEGKTLSDLIQTLKQPAEAQEVRFAIQKDNYQDYGNKVIEAMEIFVNQTDGLEVELDNEEGIRVNVSDPLGSGWFLLRMSLHEPLLVLQVENDVEGYNLQVFETLEAFFKEYDELNLEKLYAVIK